MERATGLYVHMTRIQTDLEQELRGYPDEIFEHTVFPERILFPLRWMLQNAVRFYAHGPAERDVVRERVLNIMFSPQTVAEIERSVLSEQALRALAHAPFADKQLLAEVAAERVIGSHYPEIMAFYTRTLRHFFARHQVPPQACEWLLHGVIESRSALTQRPPEVDVAAVWDGEEFEVDIGRGQVVRMFHRENKA
jgi:hypothetical protein